MKLSDLLAKLKEHGEIKIEVRNLPDGTRLYIFFAMLPFPKRGPAWYVFVIPDGQDSIDRLEIEAMLRHLWFFQMDILPKEDGGG
jgi:hypothetical protein